MPDEVIGTGSDLLEAMQHIGEDFFSPDFVDHDPAPGQPAGGAGLGWYWEQFGRSFSDVDQRIVHTVATPEHVIVAVEVSGTHTGEYLGHAATGRRFTARGVQIARFADGRMVERWGSTDQLGILQQLGLA